jgi:hypothetical protein
LRVQETLKRQQEEMQAIAAAMSSDETSKCQKTTKDGMHRTLYFLEDNIGRAAHEYTLAETSYMAAKAMLAQEQQQQLEAAATDAANNNNLTNNNNTNQSLLLSAPELILDEETEARQNSSPEERIVTFQQLYKSEMKRQEQILHLSDEENNNVNNNNHCASNKQNKIPSSTPGISTLSAASPNHDYHHLKNPALVENDNDNDDMDDDDDDDDGGIKSIIAWEDGDLWFVDASCLGWHKK